MPNIRSIVRGLPRRTVAQRLGISVSTVSRYRQAGEKIPDKFREAILSLAPEKVPPRRVKKVLKLSVQALAALAHVSPSTARRWKQAGKIPPGSQGFLTEKTPEAAPKRLTTKTRRYVSRFGRGTVHTVEVGAIYTTAVRILLAGWADSIPKNAFRGVRYQFVADGSLFIEHSTELHGSAKLPPPKGGEAHVGQVNYVSPGLAYSRKSQAFDSMVEDLDANEHLTLYVQTVTCYIRKNNNPL